MKAGRRYLSWKTWPNTPSRQMLLLSVAVALLCYLVPSIEGALLLHPQTSWPLWPGCALLVCVLLFVPRRRWFVLILAAFAAFVAYDLRAGVPLRSIAWFIPANTIEVLVAAFGLSYLFGGPPRLNGLRNLVLYFLSAVIPGPAVAAVLSASGIEGTFSNGWLTAFFSEVLAFLTLAPAVLGWINNRPARTRHPLGRFEASLLLASLVILAYLSLIVSTGSSSPAFLYSLIPLLLWSALRFGITGTSSAAIVVTLFALWGEAHRRGPFVVAGHLVSMVSLQLFLIFTAIPFMVLAALAEDRAEAEAVRRERETDLLAAQRVAHLGSWQWDPKSGAVSWSWELYRITGRTPNSKPPSYEDQARLYTPESWERLKRAIAETLRSGAPYELDLEIIRPDGARRWITDRGEALCDASGRIASLRGTAQDITERKQAEDALRQSEEKFRRVFRGAGVGMLVVAPDGHFLAANKTFCDYLGYSEEELLKKTVQSITFPEDWPTFSRRLTETLKGGGTFQNVEKRCLHKSGRIVVTQSSASLICGLSGEPLYLVGEALDITERKAAEQALAGVSRRLIEAHEEERSWIARELHDDFSQRIAFLSVSLDRLRQDLSASAFHVRKRIAEASALVSGLATDIQALSHRLHSSRLHLLGLASAASGLCKDLSERHNLEIKFHAEDVPKTLSEEISLCLFRVLQEALQNAFKHSGVRRFDVFLAATPTEVELRVHDSGAGFDLEQAAAGPGLGLTSMKERVKLIAGQLFLDSSPGAGTTVQVRVPVVLKAKAAS